MKNNQWNGVSSGGGVEAAAKQDIYISLIFILAKRKKAKLGLGEIVVLDLSKKLENTRYMLYQLLIEVF